MFIFMKQKTCLLDLFLLFFVGMILTKAQTRMGLMVMRRFSTKPRFPHIGYQGKVRDKEEEDPLAVRQRLKQQQKQTQMEKEEDEERAKVLAKAKEQAEAEERKELPPSREKREEEEDPMAPIGVEEASAIRASANLPPLIETNEKGKEEPLTGVFV